MARDRTVVPPHPLSTVQWIAGGVVLVMAIGFYVVDRTEPATHFIGPRFFAILLGPIGAGLIASGMALRSRWPGWQVLQLAPWVALALTVAWFRSLR
jgi:multisubunit Na+/H+ antiporter MnhG subunit